MAHRRKGKSPQREAKARERNHHDSQNLFSHPTRYQTELPAVTLVLVHHQRAAVEVSYVHTYLAAGLDHFCRIGE